MFLVMEAAGLGGGRLPSVTADSTVHPRARGDPEARAGVRTAGWQSRLAPTTPLPPQRPQPQWKPPLSPIPAPNGVITAEAVKWHPDGLAFHSSSLISF